MKVEFSYILIGLIVLTGFSCQQSEDSIDQKNQIPNDENPAETRTYINEFGEITLSQVNDSVWHTSFKNNQGFEFDTTMINDSEDQSIMFFSYGENEQEYFLKYSMGGLSISPDKIVVIEFGSYGALQAESKIPEMYTRSFYRSDKKVTIKGDYKIGEGLESFKVDGIFFDKNCGSQIDEGFYHITGKLVKEVQEDSFGKKQYGLILKNCEFKKPEPNNYVGYPVNISTDEAAIAWEFADSEAYILEGHEPWTEEDLSKKITVKGYLVQNSQGSYLKNWEIIE